MDIDIGDTIAANSAQQNAVDYMAGPKDFTIAESRVFKGKDQPVHLVLAEDPQRPYKPSKSMRRVLVKAWGPDSQQYVGRRIRLYCDPAVKWGGKPVGGIKVGALSHLDKPLKIVLPESSSGTFEHTVQPLPDAPVQQPTPSEPSADEVAASTDVAWLRGQWKASSPARRAQIEARVTELGGAS